MMFGAVGIIFQTVLSVCGLYKIKSAPVVMSWDMCLGIGCYGVSFILWIWLLRVYPVTIVFPLALSLNLVATQMMGYWCLGEKFDFLQVMALICVAIAIILLAVSGRKMI